MNPDEIERLNALIDTLIAGTQRGTTRWKAVTDMLELGATSSSEVYVCGLRSGSVTLSRTPVGVRIAVSDSSGDELISAGGEFSRADAGIHGVSPLKSDRLHLLWEEVRQHHTRVSDALDAMIREVDHG